ncbi:MAG TPA: M6 family metalloprotease domain-containing protein [Gemmatimonadales bacterium]
MIRRFRLAALGLAAALVPGVTAEGQAPRGEVGRFEVIGLDFRPDGAWRRRAREVRTLRRALRQARDFQSLNAPLDRRFQLRAAGSTVAQAVTGQFYVPTVLISYSDVPVGYPTAQFQDVIFSDDPGSLGLPNRAYTLKTFYEELSNNLISLDGQVLGPVRVDTTASYYQDNCNGIGVIVPCPNGGQRFGNMLLAVLDSLSLGSGGDTLWNRFDNDGPDGLPNSGDDDGVVDFVSFLQPTADGACGTPGVWAHRYVIRAWNSGSRYVTLTPRRDAGGNPVPGQFLLIDDYLIQSQRGGVSGCDPNAIMAIGTIAHETGHAFGLPDLYDTDASSRTEGIGHWGLMGSGNNARPYSPSSYEAWSLAELGWVALEELTASRTITTGARQLTDTVFLAHSDDPTAYVMIENRQAAQSDTAQMNPVFASPKQPGLLIWLIDEERIDIGRASNTVNTGFRHGVALMQADGLNQLRTPGSRNRGDTGDSYPGSSGNPRFGLSTNPSARNNFGEYLGFVVDQIEELPGQVMRFRFLRRAPSLFAAGFAAAQIRVNAVTTGRFEDVIPAGDPVTLDVDAEQTTAGGRTRARFLAWSNGGPRTQNLESGVKPDTVTASFAVDHRVMVLVSGGGTVTASAAGDLGAGVYVGEGSPVTLTATPPTGILFAGWSGDTASASPVLQLQVRRPYDLTALFVADLQIAEADATAEILGGSRLSLEQRFFLDTFGNRNGGYDLGDYLAFLRRAGLAPSPAVLSRIGGKRDGGR